ALAVIAVVLVLICILVLQGSSRKTEKETSASSASTAAAVEQSSSVSSSQESSIDPQKTGYFDKNVFIYDQQGYELFYGTDTTAGQYAAAVSSVKKSLGSKVNVYNMVVPTHSVYGMPEKYLTDSSDERSNINKIYTSYTEDVIPLDIYDTLDQHKSEYIYFKTDNNWTALGAYYAYETFCEKADVQPLDKETLSTGKIENFKGSLLQATVSDEQPDGNEELNQNPDTVTYYNIPGTYDCRLLENGSHEEKDASLIAKFAEGSNAYSAFVWGDNPYMKIRSDKKTGRKLCIIKDSYGCALAPFTASNFDEVYIVDPRYYDGSVIDYIKKNKYTDVLIVNSIMNANTTMRTDWLYSIIK
ncbi:MAG: hypothetical protein II711_03980, partial [Clostridia bacterium]|nr:hypothetical protein [Clostridia bacterium]